MLVPASVPQWATQAIWSREELMWNTLPSRWRRNCQQLGERREKKRKIESQQKRGGSPKTPRQDRRVIHPGPERQGTASQQRIQPCIHPSVHPSSGHCTSTSTDSSANREPGGARKLLPERELGRQVGRWAGGGDGPKGGSAQQRACRSFPGILDGMGFLVLAWLELGPSPRAQGGAERRPCGMMRWDACPAMHTHAHTQHRHKVRERERE